MAGMNFQDVYVDAGDKVTCHSGKLKLNMLENGPVILSMILPLDSMGFVTVAVEGDAGRVYGRLAQRTVAHYYSLL